VSLRGAVLLSGSGRTLENFFELAERGELPLDVRLVISSSREAFGLQRAARRGVAAVSLVRKEFGSHEAYSEAIFAACREARVDVVLLAGFLKLLRPIPGDFQGKVLNIHPALIPAFCGRGYYGDRVHQAVLDSGVEVTGCTVHFVDDEYDHGPIVLQRTVPVLAEDDVPTLADRVFAEETLAYPEAIRLFAAGRLKIEGRRVRVLAE